MNRRDFLKLAATGAALWATGIVSRAIHIGTVFAQGNQQYHLVAVKNGSPEKLFDEGIKALGGMPRFVKKGQKVLIKPNCAQPLKAEYASNTNPLLLKRIIQHVKDAGASKIYVTDHSRTDQNICFEDSGVKEVCKSLGAIIVPADDRKYYHEKTIKGAKRLHTVELHEMFIEADSVINVPILKHHESVQLTMAMKNLMGIVWERWFFHSNDLHQCIADLSLYRKPDLNVLDAYYMLQSHGPRGGNLAYVRTMKSLLLSTDIVTLDAAGAKLFGIEPDAVDYIKIAHAMNIGTKNLKDISISRIAL
jgi:uncharacterized protein (DUF362 family)